MDTTDPREAGTKPAEKVLLKNERLLFWGYLARKCPRCGIHQPFEVYPFEPSFYKNDPMDMLAQSVRPLVNMGACPIYEPEDNPKANYLHVCAFCGKHEVSESHPQAEVNVYWEPVDRFRILAETTACDRSYLDEKRRVSFSSASRFFRSIRQDRRYRLTRNLAPLGVILVAALVGVSVSWPGRLPQTRPEGSAPHRWPDGSPLKQCLAGSWSRHGSRTGGRGTA
jgi:hypothetical protein